uniref:Thiophen and furan oxidation protein n=1 Tax=Gronococcus sybilensis TaxID=3028029 RepID=A0A9Y1I2H2_9RHOD|nr:thiophen and furan oxidation protein [Gronococcus sybilensis]
MKDTITAIATAIAIGEGSVAIVRISGTESIGIAHRITRVSSKNSWESHKLLYGWVKDPISGSFIDEVLILIMLAPNSYTKEDVIEIHCHGGIIIAQQILQLVLKEGARMAKGGEFTSRAFLNGRLDLSQAESIASLINAKSYKAAMLATYNLKGNIAKLIKSIQAKCFTSLSEIEFQIDFSEVESDHYINDIKHNIKSTIRQLEATLESASNSSFITNGINVCIVGQPNVGKSSILNKLVNYERAIVTNTPGTTRDIIDAEITLGGIAVRLIDTAGIQESYNLVEQMGIIKAQDSAQKANLILLVVDVTSNWKSENEYILKKLDELPIVLVYNKIDLVKDPYSQINFSLEDSNKVEEIVFTSTSTNSGIDDLRHAMTVLMNDKVLRNYGDSELLLNERQAYNLIETKECLQKALRSLEDGYPCDIVSIHIREGIQKLQELTGEELTDSLFNKIFSRFCVGK